jgi:NADH-quinone oxidoreductase subunit E
MSRQNLIPLLQEVQEKLGYLSPQVILQVSSRLGLSPAEVYGVATFYSQFRFHPPGRHCLKVCQGTACHVRGSGLFLDTLMRKLGIKPGETTADREYSLERVMCLGSCALAPVVVCDEQVHGRVTQRKLDGLLHPSQEAAR